MGIGLEGAFGAMGATNELEKLLAQRTAERMYQDKLRQQAFENQMRTRQFDSTEELKQAQLASLEQSRQATAESQRGANEDRRIGLANSLADQIPGGTFMPPSDPAVGMLRTGGRGSLLREQQERPAVDVGPLLPGDTGEARPQGFIKTASFKQASDEAERSRKTEAADAALNAKQQQIDQAGQLLGAKGELLRAQADAAAARAEATRNKATEPPKLPQREDDTVVSIHQMSPLIDELLQKTQARIASKPKPQGGVMGTLGAIPEKAGRLLTKGAYSAGLPVAPADSERIQLASLLQILGTVPYLRGIRNMQFVNQIQQHLADPSATDESLVDRLTTLKRLLPGMEQAIYDVHNKGVIPHSHENMGGGNPDPLGLRK